MRERQSREFAAAVADIAAADQEVVLGILRRANALNASFGEAVAEAALEQAANSLREGGRPKG
jgi:hypothetical protein